MSRGMTDAEFDALHDILGVMRPSTMADMHIAHLQRASRLTWDDRSWAEFAEEANREFIADMDALKSDFEKRFADFLAEDVEASDRPRSRSKPRGADLLYGGPGNAPVTKTSGRRNE